MKTITYDDYLRLTGLLTLAADHRRSLEAIERSACALTGDKVQAGSHTSDAVWCEYRSLEYLLDLLGIAVVRPPVPPVPPVVTWAEVEATAAGVGEPEAGSELTELDPRWG